MITVQIFDLSVPNALGGYFLSSLSMCSVNKVFYTVTSGTSTGTSENDDTKVQINANSVFDGVFTINGQIRDSVTDALLSSKVQ
jgi:hypothetical protein